MTIYVFGSRLEDQYILSSGQGCIVFNLDGKRILYEKMSNCYFVVENHIPEYLRLSGALKADSKASANLIECMVVHDNFLSESEENLLVQEIEPIMKRRRYEFDHWDDAIHGYRECEKLEWKPENMKILDRVRKMAFPPHVPQLKQVHVLDLDAKGYIKPHIDAIRFCGNTIAGISLLSDSIMRLIHDKNKNHKVDILLKRRSLYIMKNFARFEFTHEILSNENSFFDNQFIEKTRRISVICRNEPDKDNTL